MSEYGEREKGRDRSGWREEVRMKETKRVERVFIYLDEECANAMLFLFSKANRSVRQFWITLILNSPIF